MTGWSTSTTSGSVACSPSSSARWSRYPSRSAGDVPWFDFRGLTCPQLRVEMDQSQSRLDREFGRLVDDVLIEMELSDFEGLWETVEREFASREATWVQFEADLQTIERRRQVDMSSEIQAVVAELVDIGFQLPEEIEKDFEPEVNSVNELIVSNRVAFLGTVNSS